MTTGALFTFIGGVGLFLLGMRLMTDGLKVAAGNMLRSILEAATRSRLRALASGVAITALVQSSSAVVFATVGFVNAGLLTLHQAVGVIYGANLGTTLTSWIVAVIGFNVNLQALSLPAIGLGMAFWIAFGARKHGALGQAIAGFGLFFLGIDLLRDTFAGIGEHVAADVLASPGTAGVLLFAAVGAALTVLMQSSSAALAVTLTAAAGGLVPLAGAAAMVIGANVGTTSTAAFAAVGATAPARRAATAHVAFNAITGAVALVLLPVLLWLVDRIALWLALGDQAAVRLAVFHTLVNVLGIVLLWPMTGPLVRRLERRFGSAEENESKPRYLDRTVQATPALAIDALAMELRRMSDIAHRLARHAISAERGDGGDLSREQRIVDRLNLSVAEFASGIARAGSDSPEVASLPDALRVGQYLANVADNAVALACLESESAEVPAHVLAAGSGLRAEAIAVLDSAGRTADEGGVTGLEKRHGGFETEYQRFKSRLLRAGTAGELTPRQMATMLEQISRLHRTIDQAKKAAMFLHRFSTHEAAREAAA